MADFIGPQPDFVGPRKENVMNAAPSTPPSLGDDIQKQMGSLLDNITGELSSIDPSAMLSQLSGAADEIQNKVKSMASSVISGDAGNLAETLTKTAESFLKNPTELMSNMKLGSIMDNVAAGTKESKSKVESLAGDSSGALENPVSFVTKTQKDTINGLTTGKDKSSNGDLLPKGTDKSFLDTLAKRTGLDSIIGGSGLSSAFKSISSSFSSGLSSATSGLSSFTSDIKSGMSTISGYIGSGISAVKDTVGGALSGIIGGATSITSGITGIGSDIVKSVGSILPDGMSKRLTSLTDSFSKGLTRQVSSYLTGSIKNAVGKLPGGDIINSLLGINKYGNTFNNYPAYGNGNGSFMNGKYGTGNNQPTSSDMNMLNKLAMQLCPNVKGDNFPNYRNNKDLFDMSLDRASRFGMSDLLRQLMKCQNFFDERSTAVVKNNSLRYATEYGDPYTYNVGASGVGYENLGLPYDDLRYLNGNMTLNYDVEDVLDKESTWDQILDGFDIDTVDLVSGRQYGDHRSYNSPYIGVMSHSNTRVIDNGIGRDDRVLGLQLLKAFS